MTHSVIDVALDGARAALDTDERIWLIGIGRLVGVPPTREFSAEEVAGIVSLTQHTSGFPTGPFGYIPEGFRQELTSEYRYVSLVSPSAPHLQMQLGLGHGGFAAAALTRSGTFDDGAYMPSAVLLTDMESIMADVYSLAITTAVYVGYIGPVEMGFVVSNDGPGATPDFFALDEDSGELTCTAAFDRPLEPLYHRYEFTEDSTAASVHDDLIAVATRFAARIGVDGPQLVARAASNKLDYINDPIKIARTVLGEREHIG